MHKVDHFIPVLADGKRYIDGGKEPKATKLLKRSTIILPIECYDDCCVAAKRTAA